MTWCSLLLASILVAQQVEVASHNRETPISGITGAQALFDIQFQLPIGANIAPNSPNQFHNGVAWTGTEFWFSRWNSDTLWTTDANGNLTATFTIPNVAVVRSITWDGTHLYMGSGGSQIWVIDPVTKTRVSTIDLGPGNVGARMCTYDPNADNGNGGFYIANFGSDIQEVNMSGIVVNIIPTTTHGAIGIYGGAVDNLTPGGPFLWLFTQAGNPSNNLLVQLTLSTGLPTGLVYDVEPDLNAPMGQSVAGDLFITDELVPGMNSLVVLTQDDVDGSELIAYELAEPVNSIEENALVELQLLPNPATDILHVQVNDMPHATARIVDMKGALVQTEKFTSGIFKVDVSELEVGMYLISVTDGKQAANERFVVQR